ARIQFESLIEIRDGPDIISSFRPDDPTMRPGVGKVRIETQRAFQIARGHFQVAAREKRSGAIVEERGPAGIEFNGSIKIYSRAVQIALFSPKIPHLIPGVAQPRIEFEGMIEALKRGVSFASSLFETSEICPHPGIARVKFDGLIEIFQRSREIIQSLPRQTAIAPGRRLARFDGDCAIVIAERRFEIASTEKDVSTIEPCGV